MTGLTVVPELRALVRVGAIWCDVGRVLERDPYLDEPLEDAARAARESTPADTAVSRSLYKGIGIDPTRTRPSSEALLRRVRKGERFILCDRNKPFAELRPLRTDSSGRRPFGLAHGRIHVPDDFNEPLPEVEALFSGKE